MQKGYVVLSEAERAKGFVRPVRHTYTHVGARPKYATRPLTPDEQQRYAEFGYVAFEVYPESRHPINGRFLTAERLRGGCGTDTTMAQAIAETYARDPKHYGGTYCAYCKAHFPVGAEGEFVWAGTDEKVGT